MAIILNTGKTANIPISRRTALSALGAGAAVATIGFGRTASAQAPATLRYGLSSYPAKLAPWEYVGSAAATVKLQMFRGLLSYGTDGRVQPEVAASWEQKSPVEYIFKIRPNVFFHDGTPVTAVDAKFSFESIAAEKSTATLRARFQTFERVDVIDPQTLRIVLKEANVTLPELLASYDAFIVSQRANDADKSKFVGCGPYVLEESERGSWIQLKAFDKFYRAGLPASKSLRFIAFPDESARVSALLTGSVDMIEFLPPQRMAEVEADTKLQLDSVDGPTQALIFNVSQGPLADPRVRNAVGYAINRQEIANAVFAGRARVVGGIPVKPGTPFYDAETSNRWTYDPAKARALLKEAGHEAGFETSLLAPGTFSQLRDLCVLVQQQLGAINIAVKLNLPDFPTMLQILGRGQFGLSLLTTQFQSNDPDQLTSLFEGPYASYGYKNARISKMLAEGRVESDATKRLAIYKRLYSEALTDAPFVSMVARPQAFGLTRKVKNFKNLPGNLTFYSGLSLQETRLV